MATNRLNGGVIGPSVENTGQTSLDTQTFNSDGTWTRPQAAISTVDICVIGGGGGAMGQSGGGGGAGGLPQATTVPVSAPVTITAGGGGEGGGTHSSTAGGESDFKPGGREN